VERSSNLTREVGGVWEKVAQAYQGFAPHFKRYFLLEGGPMGSTLFRIARMTLRLPVEKAKTDDVRLIEYRDSALDSLALRLYSPAPIHDSVEVLILTHYFNELQQALGDDPVVTAVLAGRTPREAAEHYVKSSKLKDVEERKRLAADANAGQTSKDGMMELVRLLDPAARAVRKRYEDTVEAVDATSAAKIAKARLAVYPNEYPDATFTPRVTYGAVKGYTDKSGKPVAPRTTIGGLYERATGEDPYKLPPRWVKGKDLLIPSTPFNFVSTVDITGGNSGSPTVNSRNEVVGIIFDGNIESLPLVFVYDDARARAVHVASQGIIEALRKLYRTEGLLKELLP
jgi:hypothetical protein